MSDKFKNRYRIASARLQKWNYGWNAPYFVTICAKDRTHDFGNIADGKMNLSAIGQLAYNIWMDIPHQFEYVRLGEFVVMPNHIHGIIIIEKLNDGDIGGVNGDGAVDGDAINRVSTFGSSFGSSLGSSVASKCAGGITRGKNPMLCDNLSRIIRWYKGRVSFESHKINFGFGWQSRFHEHIIRNHKSHNRISDYIIKNAELWDDDQFNEK